MTAPGPPRAARVLHVAHYSLPHIGGLETVVAAETRRLAARGWEVALLSSAWGARAGRSVEDGVRVVRVRAWSGLEPRFGVPFPVFSPWLLVAMFREVRRADVVHVHDPLYLTSWVAAFWCLVLRTPYVVHRHVGFVHHSSLVVRLVQRVVLGSFARIVLRGAAVVVPIDEFIAAGTRRSLGDSVRVEVVGNGVDTELFRPAAPGEQERLRTELGLPVDQPLALFVGRFVPKKGFAQVAAAASDDYGTVFAGGDRPVGVDDERLHFLGGRPAAEMPAVYRCADAMVVASVGECPLTVLEAMSSGLPVLANDDPALHSPWTSGPGVRFVDISSGDLRPALEDLVADRASMRSAGAQARAFVEGAFSWDAHVDRLESLYDELRASPHDR
ncbi:glycosyltransferase family 4 protein [Marmoricola sp. URHB0036]|uniref:glycosyltransferase family 4 protein n=1 Tax=Marmoricola sp. URHB0036 TaxID=1298863 RepID=UPI000426930C|nr:glycosyltransferase family 4 protein [Marmoricola sp. URHB0036]